MHRIDLLASARRARQLAAQESGPRSDRLHAQAETLERLARAEASLAPAVPSTKPAR